MLKAFARLYRTASLRRGTQPASRPGAEDGLVLVELPAMRLFTWARERWRVQAFLEGRYEPLTTRLVSEMLRPGECFVDAGAHIGYFSVIAARILGPHGKVVAVEACKENYEVLERNVAANGLANVECHHLALGDAEGIGLLTKKSKHSGGHSMVRHDFRKRAGSEQVAVRTLDSVLQGRVPALVKIDVEGAEPLVLTGMKQTLSEGRTTVIAEVNRRGLAACGGSLADFYELARECGLNDIQLLDEDQGDTRAIGSAADLDAQVGARVCNVLMAP